MVATCVASDWLIVPNDLRVRTLLSGEGRGGMQLLFRYREYKRGDGVAPAAGGAGGGRPIESLDGKASKWGVLVPTLLVPKLLLVLNLLLRHHRRLLRSRTAGPTSLRALLAS